MPVSVGSTPIARYVSNPRGGAKLSKIVFIACGTVRPQRRIGVRPESQNRTRRHPSDRFGSLNTHTADSPHRPDNASICGPLLIYCGAQGVIVVVRQDFWWFSGGQTFTPISVGRGWTIPNPVSGVLTATPNFFYRVWVDLNADIRAQGFGSVGGSAAIAQLAWDIDAIDVRFV